MLEIMNENGAVESIEVERKYEPHSDAVLPVAEALAAFGFRMGEAATHELRASYFDTPSLDLAAKKLALRYRIGGKDAGWHLKAKGDGSAHELLWPPSNEMPSGVFQEIKSQLGAGVAERLGTIATLRTTRTTVMLFAESGEAVIEIADDRVDATNEQNGVRQTWREWEAELVQYPADETLLDALEPLLVAAGATRVKDISKIQRTMSANGESA